MGEVGAIIILLIIVGSIIFFILKGEFMVFSHIYFMFGGIPYIAFVSHLTPEQLRIIEEEFVYYQKLPPKSKKRFIRKTLYFYKSKNFIPKGGIEIEERIKIYVAASAAMITYGLPLLRLPRFKDILIFPSKYYNKITKHHHVGEVNSGGAIVLSWEHIKRGFDNPNDGYNVALHELAHALRLEDYYPNEEQHFFEQQDINQLHRLYKKMKTPIRTGKIPFMRKYAGTNLEEFFAVSVEYFFEKPVEFKQQLPDLYGCICRILKQDTALLEQLNKNYA